MIEQKLISDICRLLRADEKNLSMAFQQCKLVGFLRMTDAMQIINAGIPLFAIIGNILRTNALDARNQISDGKITYDDLLCILGVYAQSIMLDFQQKRWNEEGANRQPESSFSFMQPPCKTSHCLSRNTAMFPLRSFYQSDPGYHYTILWISAEPF